MTLVVIRLSIVSYLTRQKVQRYPQLRQTNRKQGKPGQRKSNGAVNLAFYLSLNDIPLNTQLPNPTL